MRWIKNLIVITVSIVLSFIMLEIGLSVIYPNAVERVATRDHSDPIMPRPLAGSYTHTIRNSIATFDMAGMRINPNQCEKMNKVNALLVGDSNIAAAFLDDAETLGAQVTKLSLDKDLCINVYSFGVSGFGPDQNLFAINYLTESDVYDYVIFHIFADNDLGDLIRNNYYVDGRLTNTGYCYPQRRLLEGFVTYVAIRKVLRIIGMDNYLYGTLVASNGKDNNCLIVTDPNERNYAKSMRARAQLDWQANRRNQRQIYMGDRYDIEFACNSNTEAQDYTKQYLDKIILEASELALQRGLKLIYLIQPSEYDVTSNHPERLDKDCNQYDPANLTQFFVNALNGFSVINLYESFLGCNICYFTEEELPGDNHWSPHGVKLAASKIVELINHNFDD